MAESGGPLELVTVVPVANPAAGADWTFTATAQSGLLAIVATLATSAVVANRLAAYQIQDGAGHTLWTVQTPSAQAASLTKSYCAANGAGMNATGNTVVLPLPSGLVIPVGGIVKSVTTAIDVADQWSAIVLTFDNR